jgi:ATP-dependent helicase/nuclease subunit A
VSRALVDGAARERIRSDFDTTFVVEAAAGTGKTTALVERVVASVAAGRSTLARTVVVTFTDAAAGELKLRLRGAIERGWHDAERSRAERERLRAAILELEAARIGTIHSFCAELLREHPVEAGVDPQFQVAADTAADQLFERVFDRWFEHQLAAPGPGVRRILRRPHRPNRYGGDAGPRATLRQVARELVAWRDFDASWARRPFARDPEIDALMGELEALGPEPPARDDRHVLERSLHDIAAFVAEVGRRERQGGRDCDGLEAQLAELARARHWKWRGWVRKGDTVRLERRARRDAVGQRLNAFVAACGADLAPLLRDDVWPVVAEYERMKQCAGCLDFTDLLLRARDLVRDGAAVRADLQRRFTHLYVDEFQDTDPLQAELLLLLAADAPDVHDWRRVRPVPGKLFIVGDPKQSIYRFRRADVGLYEQVKRRLLAVGAELLHLTVSFRSRPAIQQLVNAAFAPRMTGASPTQAAYVPLEPFREASPGQPAIVALPVPRPYGDYGKVVNFRIDQSLPDAVAAFVSWLVEKSGWTVAERVRADDGSWREEPKPVQARHVCLLFRRLQSFGEDVTRPYVRALEARQLRHVLVGGSSFHAREEIAALRCALGAVERLDDELALFATLRGPLFALDDGVLLAYRRRFRTLHPFRALPEALPVELADVGEALAVLRDLHRHRNRRSFAETLARLLAATRAHAGFAIWPTGEQALANVGRLVDMARRADRQGLTSFRAFVEWLEREAETGDAGEAPLLEDGADGVRVMTVHKAKGLEFPIVILADLTARATPAQPARWIDAERRMCALRLAGCLPPELQEHADLEAQREREEADRILYVAATRARDLLVVPVVGDAAVECWLDALHPALYPPPDRAAVPITTTPPGCPPLGGDSVLERNGAVRPEGAVTPGLHAPQSGSHEVVWWAPQALALDLEENLGLRQQKLLQADEGGRRSTEGARRHDAWQRTRVALRARGEIPRLVVATATERARAAAEEGEDIAVETVPAAAERPHGARFGTLVHAVLAAVDLDADANEVGRLAEIEGRILGASDGEVGAAAAAVTAALAHPLLRRAARATCRRETPVALTLDDGILVEGVVDAAFEEGDGWTVVDFKTDVELAPRLDEYRAQVRLYVRAVAAATGKPARGVLLRV